MWVCPACGASVAVIEGMEQSHNGSCYMDGAVATRMERTVDQVHVYRDANREWRWRRLSENGRNVANSGEGYTHLEDCLEMAKTVNGDVQYDVVDQPPDEGVPV